MDSLVSEKLHVLWISALTLVCFFFIAWKGGFFRAKENHFKGPPFVPLSEVMAVFSLFLIVEILLIPALAYVWLSIRAGHWVSQTYLLFDTVTYGWLNLFTVLCAVFAVVMYSYFLQAPLRHLIYWNAHKEKSLKLAARHFTTGSLTWLLSFPSVVVVSQLVSLAVMQFKMAPHLEQTAVKNLKSTLQSPPLFWCTVLIIIFVVPIAEEILFRGFMQRWAVHLLGRFKGIALAAALFAGFHFSTSQGIDNIELMASLFVLGLFLGFLYEKKGTLWAPIGLHITFNAISSMMIVLQELAKQYV